MADTQDAVRIEVVHAALLEALTAIDGACRKLVIDYWVEAGTLLGAIRHGGPIPWDDDIDVSMTRRDFDRFVREAPSALGDGFTVHTRAQDPFIVPDAKVYVNGSHIETTYGEAHGIRTAHDGLFVDIFISDPVSSVRFVRLVESKLGWLITSRPWAALMARTPADLSRWARLRWQLAAHTPEWVVRRLHRVLLRRRERRSGDYVAVGEFALYPNWTHHRAEIFPLGVSEFAGLAVPVPGDTHAYLVATYGTDYMTLPPIGDRRRHISALRFD